MLPASSGNWACLSLETSSILFTALEFMSALNSYIVSIQVKDTLRYIIWYMHGERATLVCKTRYWLARWSMLRVLKTPKWDGRIVSWPSRLAMQKRQIGYLPWGRTGALDLISENSEALLQRELEPIPTCYTIASPIVKILMADDPLYPGVIQISGCGWTCQNQATVENVKWSAAH